MDPDVFYKLTRCTKRIGTFQTGEGLLSGMNTGVNHQLVICIKCFVRLDNKPRLQGLVVAWILS